MNFTSYRPTGWGQPLAFSNTEGDHRGFIADIGSPIYISWAAINKGPESITGTRLIDLYWDGILIRRWTSTSEMEANFFMNVDSWDGLAERVRLEPGNHSLTLVLDPLDTQPETNEFDNRYRLAVILTGEAEEQVEGRKPDLAFTVTSGAQPSSPRRWQT